MFSSNCVLILHISYCVKEFGNTVFSDKMSWAASVITVVGAGGDFKADFGWFFFFGFFFFFVKWGKDLVCCLQLHSISDGLGSIIGSLESDFFLVYFFLPML